MSVFKEGFEGVNYLIQNARPLSKDHIQDVVLVIKNDKAWNWIKQLVNWYGIKNSRIETLTPEGKKITHLIELVDEVTAEISKYRITYCPGIFHLDKRVVGYVYIEPLKTRF